MGQRILSFIADNPFLAFGNGIIVFSFILLFLAMGGVFLPVFILPLIVIFSVGNFFALFSLWKTLIRTEKMGLAIILLFTLCATYFSYTEPSVFTGRDQGSIAMAAIELAGNHHLAFSLPLAHDFFTVYKEKEGAALNFPGFFYTKEGNLITQFPLGYTAFLASFFQTFGITGFMIGNSILLLASSLSLFLLLQKFAPKVVWHGLILFSSGLIPLFLFHLTLTENFALFLFLFLTLQLIEFFQQTTLTNYFGMLLPALFFPFVRIEGFLFLAITVLTLTIVKKTRRFIGEDIRKRCILPGILFIIILLSNILTNHPFYRVIGKAFLKSWKNDSTRETISSFLALPSILSLYGMLAILIAGLLGSFVLYRSKKWILLLPFLLALPTFLYLLSPSITPDHPWMLRRFLFSVSPSLLLSFLFALHTLMEKKRIHGIAASFILIFLILGQVPTFIAFLTPKSKLPLFSQTTSFASHFTSTDRILIDREVTGDGFTMISGPLSSLLHIDAAYFFNPADMSRLPFPSGKTTYLLIPEEKFTSYRESLPDFRLTLRQTMDFTPNSREALPLSIPQFPRINGDSQKTILLTVTPR
ncbi:MAG: hypothetical protein WAU28_00845 [Candidatus Moraniibacteriota bacterium]